MKTIVIVLSADGAGGKVLDPRDPTGGVGGGGSKNGYMGLVRAMGRLGKYEVTAISTWRDRDVTIDGVRYVRIDRMHEVDIPDVFACYYDVMPLQGNPAPCRIALHHTCVLTGAAFSWFDINTAPSAWAVEHLRRRYRPHDTWRVLPNAVEGLEGVVREPVAGRVVHHVSPDRGAHQMLKVWPAIRKAVPGATLHMVGALDEVMAWEHYQGLDRCYEAQRAREMRVNLAAAEAAGGVKLLGRLTRPALLRELAQASCFAFPAETSGPTEVWSISIHECLAIGVPVVLAPIDALGSMWGGAVVLSPAPVRDFLDDFAEGVIEVLTNPEQAEACSRAGKERVAEYSFDHSARVLDEIITEWHADVTLDGPIGPFKIPGAPRFTRRNCEFLSRQVWDGEYRHPEIRAPKTAIDIGAGWGAFTAWAIKEWPGLQRIDCYEPHEAAADMFKRNLGAYAEGDYAITFAGVKIGDGTPVRLHEAAVTSDPKAVYAVGDDWGAGRITDQGQSVKTVHPRDLPPADMAKVDCEGSEADVLRHYPHIAGLQTLLLEWHTPALKAECHALIRSRTKLRLVQEEDEKVRGYGVSIWVR